MTVTLGVSRCTIREGQLFVTMPTRLFVRLAYRRSRYTLLFWLSVLWLFEQPQESLAERFKLVVDRPHICFWHNLPGRQRVQIVARRSRPILRLHLDVEVQNVQVFDNGIWVDL